MKATVKSMYYFIYEYEIGKITIAEENAKIIKLVFGEVECGELRETALIKETQRQLTEYFSGERQQFDLPLELRGTDFQKKVWKALMTIPYGEVRSYAQIAAQIGNSKACRAVGMANHRNPVSIIVPCHRVVGATGKLTGYAGGIEIKSRLLKLEEAEWPNGC